MGVSLVARLAALGLDVAPGELSDDGLRERAVGLRRLIDELEAAFAQVAHTLEVRAIPTADGHLDAPAWLATHAQMGRARGRAAVRLGAGLAASGELGRAVADGEVSPEAAAVVLGVRNPRTEAAWVADEALLVDLAARHTPDELRRLVRHWAAGADPDGPDPATDPERNSLTVAMVGGRGMLRGDFDAESTAVVAEALAAVADEGWRAAGEGTRRARSAARWRAEALVELVRRAGAVDPDSARLPRPSLTVVVDLADLRSPGGRLVELATGEPVAAEAIRRLGCDATVAGVVMGPGRRPLVAGRSRRLPTAAQARAVAARDRGCGLAHCHAPPRWCEIHHLRHWADGGATDVDNLLMICRRHHRLVHEGGHAVERQADGSFELGPPHARGAAAHAA